LEEYAASELASHIEEVTGIPPKVIRAQGDIAALLANETNVLALGRVQNNHLLAHLAGTGYFESNKEDQGAAIAIKSHPAAPGGNRWLAILCGADSRGTLYAVRDFCHYYCYRDREESFLFRTQASFAPQLKIRQLSESGCNLFSATNPNPEFMNLVHLNVFSTDVVFNKQYFVDWLSEWKINQVTLVWCNFKEYQDAYSEFIKYAHSRGIKVFAFYVPYRPAHEGTPPEVSNRASAQ
jgi:hypothetical protein